MIPLGPASKGTVVNGQPGGRQADAGRQAGDPNEEIAPAECNSAIPGSVSGSGCVRSGGEDS
jgi:hypothetical protein